MAPSGSSLRRAARTSWSHNSPIRGRRPGCRGRRFRGQRPPGAAKAEGPAVRPGAASPASRRRSPTSPPVRPAAGSRRRAPLRYGRTERERPAWPRGRVRFLLPPASLPRNTRLSNRWRNCWSMSRRVGSVRAMRSTCSGVNGKSGDSSAKSGNCSRAGRKRASTTRRTRSTERRFQAQRLQGAVVGQVDRVVQPILDVAVQRRHEAIPQPALGEDQEADAVELVHGLHDAGEERLGHAVGIVAAARQQQVFELVEGDDDRQAQLLQDAHQHLEQRQHEVLPAGPHLELQFGEAVGQETRQVGLVAEQDGAGEALEDVRGASGRPCCAPRFGRCARRTSSQRLVRFQAGLVAGAADGAGLERQRGRPSQAVDEPLRALQRLRRAQAELAGPAGPAPGPGTGRAVAPASAASAPR